MMFISCIGKRNNWFDSIGIADYADSCRYNGNSIDVYGRAVRIRRSNGQRIRQLRYDF